MIQFILLSQLNFCQLEIVVEVAVLIILKLDLKYLLYQRDLCFPLACGRKSAPAGVIPIRLTAESPLINAAAKDTLSGCWIQS